MAFSLLLLAVCWDPGDVPGSATVTALPTSSAEAAAAALPGTSGTAPAPSDDVGATATPPSRSATPPTLPANSSGSPSARPGTSRTPGTGPGTGTPQAPASRTAPPQGSGPHTSLPPTAGRTAPPSRPSAGTPSPPRTQPPTRTRRPSAPGPLPHSPATRLLIPYLRINAPIMPLGLDRERRLTAPPEGKPKLVGWYRHGASPGEQGVAVAVGHLDTDRGPAVFAGLTELKRGRIVEARRADGRTAVYTVDAIKSYEKARFPSQEVYGARGRPELRLITCGGAYDRRKGYSGNVVVFAHLTAVR
ncbi:class F sortase [Streptomyces koelreuteriae]|uniref:class F sortase n=1 Tax=Streptomyces TaxID=1883 RepID=UPI002AA2A0B6|nr:class F sortase [Streptomyces koelreuteriae]